MNKMAKRAITLLMLIALVVLPTVAMAATVATIERTDGVEEFNTLEEALNDAKSGETVKLVSDYTLSTHIGLKAPVVLGAKLTISGSVSIDGNSKTITRDPGYTGTLFNVAAGNALELKNLTIDGGNNYTFDQEAYETDLKNLTSVSSADAQKYFTLPEGAPVATQYMMTVGGKLNLNNVAIKNHYSNGSGLVSASTGAEVTLTNTKITHCANATGSGLVVNASSGKWDTTPVITVTMNEGTVIDGNHVGGNHGVFKIYMGTVFNMNGGSIKNTTGWNSNGSAVGVYWATFNMNGGEICSNSSVVGPNNGRNAAVYLHSASRFTMTGGSICHNYGGSRGGLDAPYSSSSSNGTANITGGEIVNNGSVYADRYDWDADVNGGDKMIITGGIFTQDVEQFVPAKENVARFDNGDGTYTVKTGYYITYVLDEGVVNGVNPNAYEPGQTVKLINPTREGYTFLGWTGAGLEEPKKDLTVTLAQGAVTFTANWELTPVATPTPAPTPVPDTSDLPKTGDNSNIMLFAALLTMSAAGMLLLMRRRSTQR